MFGPRSEDMALYIVAHRNVTAEEAWNAVKRIQELANKDHKIREANREKRAKLADKIDQLVEEGKEVLSAQAYLQRLKLLKVRDFKAENEAARRYDAFRDARRKMLYKKFKYNPSVRED